VPVFIIFHWLIFGGTYYPMVHSLDHRDLAGRLVQNRAACRKKLKEHQRLALWARQMFVNQRPHTDPDPKSITTEEHLSEVDASSAADDFDEKISSEPMEHNMRISEKKQNHGPSEEESGQSIRGGRQSRTDMREPHTGRYSPPH
jgi:hypothetical protein